MEHWARNAPVYSDTCDSHWGSKTRKVGIEQSHTKERFTKMRDNFHCPVSA